MVRTLRGILLLGTLSGLLVAGRGLAADPPAAATDPGKCTIATKGDSAVKKACDEGGIKAAKKSMKEMVKAAKANGVKFDCDDCHKDDDGKYDLTDDGREKFKKLLAAVAKK